MQSTGHTVTHAVSFTPMHGWAMKWDMVAKLLLSRGTTIQDRCRRLQYGGKPHGNADLRLILARCRRRLVAWQTVLAPAHSTINDRPVISVGLVMPIMCSAVGAISASRPSW